MFLPCISLLFWLCSFVQTSDNNKIPVIEVPEALTTYVLFYDSVKVMTDPGSEMTIEKVLQLPDSTFMEVAQVEIPAPPFSLWSRLTFRNTGSAPIREHLQFCDEADSIWVYRIKEGKLIETHLTGATLKPSAKHFPSLANLTPLTLDPGESATYYFKLWYNREVGPRHLSHINLSPDHGLTTSLSRAVARQSLYAGIMVLFFLLSTFLYVMFRDKSLLYYGILMLFFIPYFWEVDRVAFVLFDFPYNPDFSIMGLSITGFVLFGFLFVSSYIRLSTHYPGYYRVYRLFSYLTVILPYGLSLVLSDPGMVRLIHNIFLGVWIILMLAPVIRLSRKKDRPARILLISAGSLLLFSLFHVVYLMVRPYAMEWNTLGFQIGTLLFSGTLLYGLFDKVNAIRLEKQHIEELDSLKTRFYANISHEFRTPLTLVMGPVKQVMEKQQDAGDRRLLNLAYRNAQRLLQLINQLLDLSKLEAGKMQLEASAQNFSPLLKSIVISFESLAVRKGIRLHFVSQQDEIPLYADQGKLEIIFYNLLSNAFKFTPAQGEVSVLLLDHNDEIEVIVKDNGIGIPAKRLPFIFDRFFQVDTRVREQEGSGIGLALVKELVELHYGSISVESKVDRGTVFTIKLPKGKTHLKEKEIISQNIIETSENPISFTPTDLSFDPESYQDNTDTHLEAPGIPSDKASVLIVEDNPDVRSYIRQHLVSSFQIIEAINGQEGVDKTLEHQPDLVISDVMMPKKNGYEVCHALKTDPRSSHIPVILLTAKAALEEKLVGLETGADDYLTKPFDTKELEVRVRNLITQRARLRKSFAEAGSLLEKTKGLNEVDKVFLQKIVSLVEEHLNDTQFGVEALAEGVNMSKVHLNRKLKALTDLSPNKFIQTYRLQKALELLQKGTATVSEIAFETGFSSSAYFVKCFREKYGKTPGSIMGE